LKNGPTTKIEGPSDFFIFFSDFPPIFKFAESANWKMDPPPKLKTLPIFQKILTDFSKNPDRFFRKILTNCSTNPEQTSKNGGLDLGGKP
jgi:hypothetical protein